ncbi:hypothetical protein HMSSN036_70590 [Paenibacillus macerans]|nr:hypothetical protein HMSSN036_70590 [Paenibacillus macerans]
MIREYSGPAAVFCLNDEMAIGFWNRLEGTGYRIGEHIHLIGFDNIELTNYMQPRLATINYSKTQMGGARRRAANQNFGG